MWAHTNPRARKHTHLNVLNKECSSFVSHIFPWPQWLTSSVTRQLYNGSNSYIVREVPFSGQEEKICHYPLDGTFTCIPQHLPAGT